MSELSAADLLGVWERGWSQPHPLRAITILAAACPDVPAAALARLPVGARDARVLAVRGRTFGSRLTGWADCPACGQRVEFAFDAADIAPDAPAAVDEGDAGAPLTVTAADGCEVEFRLPDTQDLLAASGAGDVEGARRALLERCVLGARGGMPATAAALDAVAARMAEVDAAADVRLALQCPACGGRWSAPFDAVAFFWAEIDAWARRTLRDVHDLAGAYGWGEAEILGMSSWRRECYLNMVRG